MPQEERKFEKGDTVRLKSAPHIGGVVTADEGKEGYVPCRWFEYKDKTSPHRSNLELLKSAKVPA